MSDPTVNYIRKWIDNSEFQAWEPAVLFSSKSLAIQKRFTDEAAARIAEIVRKNDASIDASHLEVFCAQFVTFESISEQEKRELEAHILHILAVGLFEKERRATNAWAQHARARIAARRANSLQQWPISEGDAAAYSRMIDARLARS